MFEPVCESFVRMANLTDYLNSIGNNRLACQKVQRVVRKRPIVKMKKAGDSKSGTDQKPNKDEIGDGFLFENYDKDGNIILRSSERKKRIGEIA